MALSVGRSSKQGVDVRHVDAFVEEVDREQHGDRTVGEVGAVPPPFLGVEVAPHRSGRDATPLELLGP